jgi:hypothetical protein
MANRWGIPKEIEEIVKFRDLSCVYCGISFINSNLNHKNRPTWEHIINDIKINGEENIAISCGSCNASKGAKKLEEWLLSKYCSNKGITKDTVAPIIVKYLNSIKSEI